MGYVETLLVALALGCDAFAVGMGIGAKFCSSRQVFRLSFHFGLFQLLMPLLGCYLGENAAGLLSRWGPWISFVLLFLIGGKMTYESLRRERVHGNEECLDPTRGASLVVLSVATSMDALGVGFSFGLIGKNLLFPALWIGFTAAVMTWSAMKIGRRLTGRFGRRMETAGGLILLAIAVKLLLS